MLETIKISKFDNRYPEKLKNIINSPTQLYVVRKYRTFK